MSLAHELMWIGAALAGGLAADRLRLPVFVGYLVIGLVLGVAGQGPSDVLIEAGEIGVLLLLFAVGLHLRPRTVLSRAVLVGGAAHLAVSITAFMAAATLLGLDPATALLWVTLLSFSSTVLAAKMLEARAELGTFHGRIAIGILILQDVVAVAVMVVVADATPSLWAFALVPAAVGLHLLLPRLLDAIESEELLLLLAAVLALGVAEAFAHARLSAELGAIAAGALVAAHPRGEVLADRLWGMKELLLVGFFLGIGMRVSPTADHWGLALGFTLLLPLKAWLFFALLVALGLRARTAFLTGVSLTSYSEFTLIAGAIAHAHGMLPLAGLSVLTLTTVISFAIHLPVNKLSHALYDRFQPLLRRFEREMSHPDSPAPTIGAARFLVLGMGRTGGAAYDFLKAQGHAVLGIDSDTAILSRSLEAGRRVVYGDVLDPQLWEGIDLRAVQGVIVALPTDAGRLAVVRHVRALAPRATISTFALHDHEAEVLRAAGADSVSYLLAEAGERLAELGTGQGAGASAESGAKNA